MGKYGDQQKEMRANIYSIICVLMLFCFSANPGSMAEAASIVRETIHMRNNGIVPNFAVERLGVHQVAYSPDGKLLAVTTSVGVWLYDAQKLKELNVISGHNDMIYTIAFSPDGQVLATAGGTWMLGNVCVGDSAIRLWDVGTAEQIGILDKHGAIVKSIAYSPDGKTLASGGYWNTIHFWDVERQKQKSTLREHSCAVGCVAFSPDGLFLASSCMADVYMGERDRTIRLWNVSSYRQVALLEGHTDFIPSLAFSPDGRYLASGCKANIIRLWAIPGGKLTATLEGHNESVFSVAYSPDGRRLASGSGGGVILVWDMEQRKPMKTLKHDGVVVSLTFSPDGRTLVSSGGRHVRVWNTDTWDQIMIIEAVVDKE